MSVLTGIVLGIAIGIWIAFVIIVWFLVTRILDESHRR